MYQIGGGGGRGRLREGRGNCLKYLKMGWKGKEGMENKDFKKWGQPGSRGGYLKKGLSGTPLQTMNMYLIAYLLSTETLFHFHLKLFRISMCAHTEILLNCVC